MMGVPPYSKTVQYEMSVDCPNCGFEIVSTSVEVSDDGELSCPSCETEFMVDTEGESEDENDD